MAAIPYGGDVAPGGGFALPLTGMLPNPEAEALRQQLIAAGFPQAADRSAYPDSVLLQAAAAQQPAAAPQNYGVSIFGGPNIPIDLGTPKGGIGTWSSVSDAAKAIGIGSAIGAGDPVLSQAAGNIAQGNPATQNIGNSIFADVVGAGATGAAVLAGGGEAAAGPELLGGPPVDSSSATTAAFGGPGETAISPGATAAGGVGAGAVGAGTAAGGAGTTATTAGAAAGGTSLSRIFDGTASTADWASVLGTGAATGLGIYGSLQQTQALKDLADRQFSVGEPSRARFEASMTPGFDPASIPGYRGALDTASESILRKLSATGGNPFGNPGGLIEANKQIIAGTALPAVQEYQRMNAGAGGLANLSSGAPGAATNAIGSQGNVYNAIGSGIASLTNPQPTLQDTLRMLGLGRGAVSAA